MGGCDRRARADAGAGTGKRSGSRADRARLQTGRRAQAVRDLQTQGQAKSAEELVKLALKKMAAGR